MSKSRRSIQEIDPVDSRLMNSTGQIIKRIDGSETILSTCFKISDNYFLTAGMFSLQSELYGSKENLFIKFNPDNEVSPYYYKAVLTNASLYYSPLGFCYAVLQLAQPLEYSFNLESVKISTYLYTEGNEVATINYSKDGSKSISRGTVLNTNATYCHIAKHRLLSSAATVLEHNAWLNNMSTGSPLMEIKSQEVFGICLQFPVIGERGNFALPIKKIIDAAQENLTNTPWLTEIGFKIKKTEEKPVIIMPQARDDVLQKRENKETGSNQSPTTYSNYIKTISIAMACAGFGLFLYRLYKKDVYKEGMQLHKRSNSFML